MSNTMTAAEMTLYRAAREVCGCAIDDAPEFATMRETLEWVRANNMGTGTDGEIDAAALDALIAGTE